MVLQFLPNRPPAKRSRKRKPLPDPTDVSAARLQRAQQILAHLQQQWPNGFSTLATACDHFYEMSLEAEPD